MNLVNLASQVNVSVRQIERWRDAGLVPKPNVNALGRGKGKQSDYPEEAIEMVEATQRLVADGLGLDDVLLHLFVEGYSVWIEKVKACILRNLEPLISIVPENPEGAFIVAEQAGYDPRILTKVKALTASLSKEDRQSFIIVMAARLLGNSENMFESDGCEPKTEDKPAEKTFAEIVVQALGAGPWSPGNPEEALNSLPDVKALREAIQTAGEPELHEVSRFVQSFTKLLSLGCMLGLPLQDYGLEVIKKAFSAMNKPSLVLVLSYVVWAGQHGCRQRSRELTQVFEEALARLQTALESTTIPLATT